jgi:hypothetical protein
MFVRAMGDDLMQLNAKQEAVDVGVCNKVQ